MNSENEHKVAQAERKFVVSVYFNVQRLFLYYRPKIECVKEDRTVLLLLFDKNGKEARAKTEGISGRVHLGR